MKRLYTLFSSLLHVAGILPLYGLRTITSSLPWANASFAQQSLFSFSLVQHPLKDQ